MNIKHGRFTLRILKESSFAALDVVIKNNLTYIKQTLKKKYSVVDIYGTTGPGDMLTKAREACGVYDVLIFSGGDGSFNEVVQGVSTQPVRPILGYLPSGTVNDIAHSLNIPCKLSKALNNILEGEVHQFDVMHANDKYAFYVVCAGAFTGCSYLAKQNKKKKFGKIAYVFEVIQHELKMKDFELTVKTPDKQFTTNCEFIVAFNSKRVASMPVNRKADLSDGLIDFLFIKEVYKPNFFNKMCSFFRIINFFLYGYNRAARHFDKLKKSSYVAFKGSEFEISVPDDVQWNFDGEAGLTGPLKLNVLNKHISVIVPKD